MKRFFSVIKNIFSIKELRSRLFNTFMILVIFRLGSFIVLPGINPNFLTRKIGGVFGILDNFLGGAFSNASILGIGIVPYISASIVMQLMTIMYPSFQRMNKEGQSGRNKINRITRFLTVFIALVQSFGYTMSDTVSGEGAMVINRFFFTISAMLILTSGTMFCLWLGDRITDIGIGNGVSMLIMVGIISSLPRAFVGEVVSKGTSGGIFLIFEFVILFFIIMGVIMFTQAVRKIPLQYAKQMSSQSSYGGERQYLPLKLNSSGVMPIIFAQTMVMLPGFIAGVWRNTNSLAAMIYRAFSDPTSWQYNIVFGLLIMLFTFFYTAITVNPNQIANDLKSNGGFIPGIKPGNPTAMFIDDILTKITFPGSLFLVLIAILPGLAKLFGISMGFSRFYGGTSLLIVVGVVLDTYQQIESYLLMHRYEGIMKSGKIIGRRKI
ncbi:MAG: preprotein translocase subunit SecY [Bacteroidetes bacterium]|nr:preprotein translocase subunit SecY [Bacteroidota bacterium]